MAGVTMDINALKYTQNDRAKLIGYDDDQLRAWIANPPNKHVEPDFYKWELEQREAERVEANDKRDQPPVPGGGIKVWEAHDALQPQPDTTWIIDQLFSAGSVSIIAGEPGSKKSYAMLDAAVCVASGQKWLDHDVVQCPALIVDEENGQKRLSKRIGQTLRGHDAGEEVPIYYVTMAGLDLRGPCGVDTLHMLINVTHAKFVVLDSLCDFAMGADENSVKDMQPLMHGLRSVAEATQSAIVAIHHTNKNGGYRGSSAIKGAVDLLLIAKNGGSDGCVQFSAEKSRDIDETSLKFGAMARWYGIGDTHFKLEVTESKPVSKAMSPSKQFVMDYLKEQGPTSSTALKAEAERVNIASPNAIRQAIHALAKNNLIVRVDQGGIGQTATYNLSKPI